MLENYIPVLVVMGFAVIFSVAVVASSSLFGPQRPTVVKSSPYESGMKPIGSTEERISVKYYVVAMLFIIFDLEVIFVYPWAVEFIDLFKEFGISAFISMFVFLVVFELGFLYAYKKGGFRWD
ncbi:MAG: NADH-quinone oxidoreductase subunit A [Ignavibacteriales bacterium]|jgi:NADH-quinone oxidoreductase subunit A|nr:NADH-quinone oxidoreductase subunit A [Ignavibacteriales bacterium]MBK7266629.1 NADH-quinone oxidoreductase subunit A [Ignavibacteriales bacterium]MBK8660363.1 NADH-quinone oxidoreductase subunit A [Ignavibacteriales bacterium]MBP9123749.1 NADH-quinone oxidoreductase subunit A [Ignavibacteriaceae bacterium]MCC6637897.1 NADH-quinone oxidoreductase subunit A [Ignavibacteriaceae bacterium]